MAEHESAAPSASVAPSTAPEAPLRTIYEKSRPGRRAFSLPDAGVPATPATELLAGLALRERPARLPEVAEIDLLRHFVELSSRDYGVEKGPYPLGSCTMKYNPKINERVAALEGLRGLHPYEPEELVQGALELMDTLSRWLAEIAGLDRATLQPAAGAHGELTGLLLVRAYHGDHGVEPRIVLIPDTAHGTNPASVVMAGYEPVTLPSDARGGIHLEAVRSFVAEHDGRDRLPHAHQPQHAGAVRDRRRRGRPPRARRRRPALLRRRQLQRRARPFAARRHGLRHRPPEHPQDLLDAARRRRAGGGPVVVRDTLEPYLPTPVLHKVGVHRYALDYDRPRSIGKVRSFYGNFGVLVRAYAYIRALGAEGLREVSEAAVLNATYVMAGIGDLFEVPYDRPVMHEFVVSAEPLQAARRARARRGQAPARLRRAPADDLLPADRQRSAHGRADGDRVERRPRRLRGGAARRHRRGAQRPRATAHRAAHHAGGAARRSRSRPQPGGQAALPRRRARGDAR